MSLAIDGSASDVAAMVSPLVRVVVPQNLANLPFKGRFIDTQVDEILRVLAAQMGESSMVRQREGFVYVGPPTDSDRVSSVFAVPSGAAADWSALYQLGGTPGSEVQASGDLLIIRDTVNGVKRAGDIHRALSRGRRQYVLEICFSELSDEAIDELGLTMTADGTSRLRLGTDGSVSLEAIILGRLNARKSRVRTTVISSSRVHLVEDSTQKQSVGDEVLVPTRTVSDQGTVTESGFQKFPTGLSVTASARTILDGQVRLDLDVELSELKGFTGTLPQINRRRFTTSAFVAGGGVLVLGGFERDANELLGDNVPGTGWFSSKSRRTSHGRQFLFVRLSEVSDGEDVND